MEESNMADVRLRMGSMDQGGDILQQERPVLLITTVDIGGGKSDKIELRYGDAPEEVARLFCVRHGIPTTVVGPLTEHILDNLRKANTAKAEEAFLQQSVDLKPHASDEVKQAAGKHGLHQANPKLSFANGMNDKLYEQLSAKLLEVDNNSKLLSVSASQGPLSSRVANSHRASMASERGHRMTHSAEGSPKVHSRLYKNAQDMREKLEARRQAAESQAYSSLTVGRTSMSWISQEMMKDRSSGPFDNYGEMLYAEAVEAAATRKSKAAAMRAARADSELDGATFVPEITRLAAALWSGSDLEAQPAWQRLSTTKRSKTLDRIRDMLKEEQKEEAKECTFKPQINRKSSQMMSERTETQKAMNVSAHEQLFADAIRRQRKMEQMKTWLPDGVTFAPAVNKSQAAEAALRRSLEALGLSGGRSDSMGYEGLSDDDASSRHDTASRTSRTSSRVVDRLYIKHEKTKAKLEERRSLYNGNIDPDTGRQLYVPAVGRAPRGPTARPRDGLSIGEYLYASGVEAALRKEAQLEAERQADKDAANATFSTAVSQKLCDKLRAKRFSQIFEYLDLSGCGLINVVELVRCPSPEMDNLDEEVREDVVMAAAVHAQACGVPLLPDPDTPVDQETGVPDMTHLPPAEPVDLAGFSALMEQALTKRRKPRAYLVPSPAPKAEAAHTFQPTINKRSKELAARLRPAELPLHEVLHHDAEMLRVKFELARRQAQETELEGCTFAPQVNPVDYTGHAVQGRAFRAALDAIAAGGSKIRAVQSVEASPSPTKPPVPARAPKVQQTVPQAAPAVERQSRKDECVGYAAVQPRDGSKQESVVTPVPGQHNQSHTYVHPNDLRATEVMLLEMLTASPDQLDSAADNAVINQLHNYLVHQQPLQQQDAPTAQEDVTPVSGLPGGAAYVNTYSRRSGSVKDGLHTSGSSVNLFVVPASKEAATRSRTQSATKALNSPGLDELTEGLAQWDRLLLD